MTRIRFVPAAFLFGLALMGLAIGFNAVHAATRGHVQAPALYAAYEDGICDGKWIGYNIVTGQIAVQCRIAKSGCGILVFKVTENAGSVVLAQDAYNASVYAGRCYSPGEWLARGFVGWMDVEETLRQSIEAVFGAP